MSATKRRDYRWIAACCGLIVAVGVLMAFAQPNATPSVETLLPEAAILYSSWDGNDQHAAAWKQTAAYEALYESGCIDFVKRLVEAATQQAPAEASRLVGDLFKTIAGKGISLAVALPAGQGPPLPYAVLVLHDAASLEPAIAKFVPQMTESELEWTEKEVNSRSVTLAAVPQTPGVEVGWWIEGDHLVIAGGVNAVANATAIAAGETPNLTTNKLWQKYQQQAKVDFEVANVGWFDLGRLTRTFGAMPVPVPGRQGEPVFVKQIVETLGLANVGALVCRSGYHDRALRSETLLEVSGPKTGLMAFTDQKAITLADLPPLPAETNGFCACRFNWSDFYANALKLTHDVTAFGPPDAAAQVDGAISQIPVLAGFDPKTDLCDALGDVICVFSDPHHGILGFGGGLAIKVKDSDRLRSTINRVLVRIADEAGKDFRVDRTKKHGREILMFTMARAATLGALTIDKDWLVVGLVPQTIEAFFLRLDGKLPHWRPDRSLQPALAEMPQQFSSITITDPRDSYRTLMQLAPVIFSVAQEPLRKALDRKTNIELPVTAADIPPADLVANPLFPNVAVCTVTDQGIRWTSRTSLPTMPFATGIGGGSGLATTGILVALLLPAVQSARSAARRTQSKNNLKQIALALFNYHDTFRQFPAGTHPNPQLPPEKRLSWQAEVLPFLEQSALHDAIDFEEAWDGKANQQPASTQISIFHNPGTPLKSGQRNVTHYVGIAGVGEEAPTLPVTSKKAGAFGYDRATRLRDIRDGASHTIGVTEASKDFGPWIAGGRSTIRALTKKPYINGPDGIGGPYPGGLNVMFMDGSVRFVSKKIDPSVLEALSTINGGERVSREDIP